MATDNPRKWGVFAAIIGAIVVLVLIFVSWQYGSQGFWNVVKWFFIILFFLALIGLIIFAIFWLFKRHKKQMVDIMRNSILSTCRINRNPYDQELWLFGSGVPMPNPKQIGKITGFSMIKSAVKKMKDPNTNILLELEKPKDIIFISFNSGRFLDKILNNQNIFAGIYPDDFEFKDQNGDIKVADLTASQVYINDGGFGLSPQVFKMFWLQKHWKQAHIIEETSKETIHRFLVQDNLNEIAEIIHKAVAVQPKEDKDRSLGEQIIKKDVNVGGS